MRLSEILREAWRNVASGASGPLWLAGAFVVVMVAGVGLPALLMVDATRSYRGMLHSGAATTIIRAIEGIDARACVALGEVTGVVGAAAIRHEPAGITVAALPRFESAQVEVAGDLVAVLGGRRAREAGVLVATPFAQQLGLDAGDILALVTEDVRVAGVFDFPDDGRQSILANAIVVPVPADDRLFTECWVTVWPPDERYNSLFLTVLRGESPTATAEIQLLNASLGQPRALSAMLSDSRVDLLRGGAVIASGVVGSIWLRMRRTDLALRLHAGQGRMAQCLQSCAEAALPAAVAGALVISAGHLAMLNALPSEDIGWMTMAATATTIAAIAAMLAGVCLASVAIRTERLGEWARER